MTSTSTLRVLLLNPPGDEVYLRDYYCSKVSKTNYLYTPVDLLIVSARVKDADVLVIDAIADQLSRGATLERIRSFAPDAMVFLSATVSWATDRTFLTDVRQIFSGRLIGSGDIFMDDPEVMLLAEAPELDAVLLDFTTPDIRPFCEGRSGPFDGIALKENGAYVQEKPKADKSPAGRYDIPVPLHQAFPLAKYRYPFVREHPFATVLTDFGCAFKCSFCIQSVIPFKTRSAESVMEELRVLKSIGIRDLYFSDQTFAFGAARARTLFNMMIDEKLDMGFVAFYRVDLVKEEMIALMKRAGCHTLMFGLETASDALLRQYQKNTTSDVARQALALVKRYGIRTVGTFILGFPEETRADIEATIRFSTELPLDYASFNLPVPRSKTSLRARAIEGELVEAGIRIMDQSGKHPTMGNHHLTGLELRALRDQANRRFYMRPRYLMHRLMELRSLRELRINLQNGSRLIRESIWHS